MYLFMNGFRFSRISRISYSTLRRMSQSLRQRIASKDYYLRRTFLHKRLVTHQISSTRSNLGEAPENLRAYFCRFSPLSLPLLSYQPSLPVNNAICSPQRGCWSHKSGKGTYHLPDRLNPECAHRGIATIYTSIDKGLYALALGYIPIKRD